MGIKRNNAKDAYYKEHFSYHSDPYHTTSSNHLVSHQEVLSTYNTNVPRIIMDIQHMEVNLPSTCPQGKES